MGVEQILLVVDLEAVNNLSYSDDPYIFFIIVYNLYAIGSKDLKCLKTAKFCPGHVHASGFMSVKRIK